MPIDIVSDLIDRVIELEKQVAVLLSWHKVTVALLISVLAGVLKLIWR